MLACNHDPQDDPGHALIDTSALFALLSDTDSAHPAADTYFRASAREDFMTHNAVVIEAVALVQRRMGHAAVRDLLTRSLDPVRILYVDGMIQEAAQAVFLASRGRTRSLVDYISFAVMRDQAIDTAFTFDRDFARAGFKVVP
ncbi:MAG: PIN domain-containing protein [Actinobacteria bacterium]|nr:PIN domain-containing protein [Actinomycetota bacterium]